MKKIILILAIFSYNSSLETFAQTSTVNPTDSTKSSAAVKKTGFNPDAFIATANKFSCSKSESKTTTNFNATSFQLEARKQEVKLGINSKN